MCSFRQHPLALSLLGPKFLLTALFQAPIVNIFPLNKINFALFCFSDKLKKVAWKKKEIKR